jgi:hypothetical protein
MQRLIGYAIVVAFLGYNGSGTAQAQEAAPPVGVWKGKFEDGSGGVDLVVTGGGVSIQVTGGILITGNWTWQPTARGGIITIHYHLGGRPSRLFYSVTYGNEGTVTFSDPWFRVTLKRVG